MAARAVKESLKLINLLGSTACRQQGSAWCKSLTPLAVPPVSRPFHSCTPSSALEKLIADELSYERSQMDQTTADSALQNAPEGWRLEYKPTETIMTLSKMMGNEKIVVRVNTLSDTPYEDDPPPEGSEEPAIPVPFTVDSVKGDTALRFECEYVENDELPPGILDVTLVPHVEQENSWKELEPFTYTGPRYLELDERLQSEFAAYLQSRGIDAHMGQYLCRLVYDKEQTDYVNWLDRLRAFVVK